MKAPLTKPIHSLLELFRKSRKHIAIVVDAIIVLAHNLGITVLAEGVELEEQMHQLKKPKL
jgi:EAL domain-containing protein (putative c-di-GMP-specific phosphodiesterase class I)